MKSVTREATLGASDSQRMSRTVQLICAWSGPVFVLVFMIGFVPLAHLLPAPSPSWSAARTADWYHDNAFGIRMGMVLGIVAIALLAPWGAVIAVRTRKTETGLPIFTYIQLVCLGTGVMDAMLTPLLFAWAAFRPGEIDPEITQSINDVAWFAFLFTFPPFTVWCLAIAGAILTNRSGHRLMPRWVAYLNLWAGALYFPATLILFFKRGALSYNGAIALYVPLIAFLVWIIAMNLELIKTIKSDGDEPTSRGDTNVI